MIKATVALPLWNVKDIAWLIMESLCNQKLVDFQWELIVFEEKQENELGLDWFRKYSERLHKVGCARLQFLSDDQRVTLSEKWERIGKRADKDSVFYMITAADDYYHPYSLHDSMMAINSGYDWFYTYKAYFYDFNYNKIILYNKPSSLGYTGIQMSVATELARKLPAQKKFKNINLWFSRNSNPQKPYKDLGDHWSGTLCTNGLNNISTKRWKYFVNTHYPFQSTNAQLTDIVPDDIANRLLGLSVKVRS